MDDEGLLDIRQVEVIFRGRDQVIVNGGMKDAERLVTSALSSPIAGTPLRLQQEGGGARQQNSKTAGNKGGDGERGDQRAE